MLATFIPKVPSEPLREAFYCLNKINHLPLNKNKTSSDGQDYICTNENLNELFPSNELLFACYHSVIKTYAWPRAISPLKRSVLKAVFFWGHWLYSLEIDPLKFITSEVVGDSIFPWLRKSQPDTRTCIGKF